MLVHKLTHWTMLMMFCIGKLWCYPNQGGTLNSSENCMKTIRMIMILLKWIQKRFWDISKYKLPLQVEYVMIFILMSVFMYSKTPLCRSKGFTFYFTLQIILCVGRLIMLHLVAQWIFLPFVFLWRYNISDFFKRSFVNDDT